jgi:hypothetical protein
LKAASLIRRTSQAEAVRIAIHEAEWAIREEFRILDRFGPAKAPEYRQIVQHAEERRGAAAQE